MKRSPLLVIFITVFIDLVGFGIVIPVLPFYAEGTNFGAAIGGVLSRWGINVPFLFAGGLAFANVILLYFTLPETVTPDHPARASAASGRGWGQLIASLKNPRLGFVMTIYFLSIVAFSIMTAVFSLFMMFRLGYDAFHNGWVFAYVGIISAIIQGGLND